MTRDERLNAMLDKQEITEALMRYARGVDRHDEAMVATCYHEDGIDDHTAYIGPGKTFGAYANQTHDENWAAHQHYVTNITIDLNGDEAHAESYWIVAGRRKSDHSLDMHGGRYIDRFARRNGVWAIVARVCAYEWGVRPEDVAQCLAAFPLGAQNESDLVNKRPLQIERARTC